MVSKDCVAMILAGGQGSRLGALTKNVAKPAVPFGGKYRIIDFPLSNCVHSGIDTVGVLTQYQPLELNTYIGNGKPWELDRNNGGAYVLPPYQSANTGEWYKGTANAIYQNIGFLEGFNPQNVLILSGDHIYKMHYGEMLSHHKKTGAAATIAVMPVPWEEASRFGIMIADENRKITEFEEKPANPRSNLASMGIYIFNWKTLKEALIAMADQPALDFGKHIIPYCHEKGAPMYAYEFNGYWKDVGTLSSYWEANMELIDIVPEFNLYEEYWKIYTRSEIQPPQYFAENSITERCIIGEGSEIYGEVYNSVIGCGVIIGKGTVVRDSIIMNKTVIGDGCEINKAIIAEDVVIGSNVKLGVGEEAENDTAPHIYNHGLVTIGEKSVIPDGVSVGKNSVISGQTEAADYENNYLASGKTLIKAGEV